MGAGKRPTLFRHASESWHLTSFQYILAAMRGGWVYIMTNRAYGVLYIGVTTSLPHRTMQHRDETGSEFCRRYNLIRLVYAERHETIVEAIAREKAMKAWKRQWKIELIETINPQWQDLFDILHLE